MDEEAVDLLHDHLGAASRGRAAALVPAAPVAALALSVASLIGIGPAQILSQAVLFNGRDFRTLAVAPGIGALVAVISVWLGRVSLRAPEGTWQRHVGAAAIVVGLVSLLINLAAFIGAITASDAGNLVSG